MTRRRRAAHPRHKGGLLTGMRQGVKSMAGSGHHDEDEKAAAPSSRTKNIIMNVLTGAAVIAAGAIMLHRCGVIKW